MLVAMRPLARAARPARRERQRPPARARTRAAAAVLAAVTLLASLATAPVVHADELSKDQARAQFASGSELVKAAKWSEALAAFERSFALVPHPVTLFNIGACERALGSYARARRTLLRARDLDRTSSIGTLPASARGDIVAFLSEITAILVKVTVRLDPPTATIAVDGRPLEVTAEATEGPPALDSPGAATARTADAGPDAASDATPDDADRDLPTLTAGLAAPGPGRAPASAAFRLEVDPGTHVIVLSRPGFRDVVRRETFARGEPRALDLVLARLDGALDVRSDREGSVVSVDGVDVGLAPVAVRRPAGRYHVAVRKSGFVPFETDAVLEPGGRVELSAPMPPEKTPLTKTWWFWTAAGSVVVLATATTYFVTRPDPERPAANGGGLGWVLRAP